MTGTKIIEKVNSIADDNIAFSEVQDFVNSAISKINMEMPALFPSITSENIDKDYYVMRPKQSVVGIDDADIEARINIRNSHLQSANDLFVNQLVVPYALYLIKVQDGSQYEWENAYAEFRKNMNMFITVWQDLINPIWLTTSVDIDGNGKYNENGFDVTEFAGDSYTGAAKTWGNDPGSGVYVVDSEADSSNPFGRRG